MPDRLIRTICLRIQSQARARSRIVFPVLIRRRSALIGEISGKILTFDPSIFIRAYPR
jgi:hypothetical protein